jgi:hypothetical protein
MAEPRKDSVAALKREVASLRRRVTALEKRMDETAEVMFRLAEGIEQFVARLKVRKGSNGKGGS